MDGASRAGSISGKVMPSQSWARLSTSGMTLGGRFIMRREYSQTLS
ncbi:hypothetical protein WJ969_11330 [Achromobacter xylosoxidans]